MSLHHSLMINTEPYKYMSAYFNDTSCSGLSEWTRVTCKNCPIRIHDGNWRSRKKFSLHWSKIKCFEADQGGNQTRIEVIRGEFHLIDLELPSQGWAIRLGYKCIAAHSKISGNSVSDQSEQRFFFLQRFLFHHFIVHQFHVGSTGRSQNHSSRYQFLIEFVH